IRKLIICKDNEFSNLERYQTCKAITFGHGFTSLISFQIRKLIICKDIKLVKPWPKVMRAITSLISFQIRKLII
ncbi:hypothetical protein PSZ89_22620, partial [Shigella sonnei]|nr:hypothetical protein [Shigella sonnei]